MGKVDSSEEPEEDNQVPQFAKTLIIFSALFIIVGGAAHWSYLIIFLVKALVSALNSLLGVLA